MLAAGDTVEVACGTYYEHSLFIGQQITLTSETGDPDCVAIDGQMLARLLTCDTTDPPTTQRLFQSAPDTREDG